MPSGTPLRVCVAALVFDDRGSLKPDDLRALTGSNVGHYPIDKKGGVYGDSPDEWAPFEDGVPISKTFTEAGFEVVSLSSHLTLPVSAAKLKALVSEVDLYIFDPLFLALYDTRSKLIDSLDQAASSGVHKGYCVVLPKRMPDELRERLSALCSQRLALVQDSYDTDGWGEWEVESKQRLVAILKRLLKEMKGGPLPRQLNSAQGVLITMGAPAMQMDQSPRLGHAT